MSKNTKYWHITFDKFILDYDKFQKFITNYIATIKDDMIKFIEELKKEKDA